MSEGPPTEFNCNNCGDPLAVTEVTCGNCTGIEQATEIAAQALADKRVVELTAELAEAREVQNLIVLHNKLRQCRDALCAIRLLATAKDVSIGWVDHVLQRYEIDVETKNP